MQTGRQTGCRVQGEEMPQAQWRPGAPALAVTLALPAGESPSINEVDANRLINPWAPSLWITNSVTRRFVMRLYDVVSPVVLALATFIVTPASATADGLKSEQKDTPSPSRDALSVSADAIFVCGGE